MAKDQWVRLLHQRSSRKKKIYLSGENFLVKNGINGQSRERNPMREALQSSHLPLYLKKRVYIWSYCEMGLKLGQNINFWLFFFGFLSVSGCDKAFWSRQGFLVATKPFGCDTGRDILLVATLVSTTCLVATQVATYFLSQHIFLVAIYFLTATCFSSPPCRGHNFFILTLIWACEYSLERSLNVECIHEEI